MTGSTPSWTVRASMFAAETPKKVWHRVRQWLSLGAVIGERWMMAFGRTRSVGSITKAASVPASPQSSHVLISALGLPRPTLVLLAFPPFGRPEPVTIAVVRCLHQRARGDQDRYRQQYAHHLLLEGCPPGASNPAPRVKEFYGPGDGEKKSPATIAGLSEWSL